MYQERPHSFLKRGRNAACLSTYRGRRRRPEPIDYRKTMWMFLKRKEAEKRALADSESEIQKKLCELSEPTSSMPQSSMPKQSLHKAFKKKKKTKKVVMKPRASTLGLRLSRFLMFVLQV